MSARTRLKVGDRVKCRYLGVPEEGVIEFEREDGNFNVRLDRGLLLPSINWYDPTIKRKPWYIESFNGVTVTVPPPDVKRGKTDDTEIQQAFDDQKKFIRGKIKK